MGSIWHIGIAVPALEEGKKELSDVFGLRWRPARVRKLTLVNAGRRALPPGSEFAGEPLLGSAP
jgi:hypothetical protein